LINKLLSGVKLSANRRKIFANVYWAVLGKVVSIVCGLLVGIMVARYFGPEQFGLMNYVVSYVMLFSVFSTFGLDGIEIRELSKHNADKESILGTAFALRMTFAVVTILLILVTLWQFESDKYTSAMVMVYSLSLIFGSLNVIRNYFTSIILNEYVVKTEIFRTLIGSGIKVLLLAGHCSLTWFIVASTFDFVLIGGGYLYSYRKNAGRARSWRFSKTVARLLIRESFPLMLSGAAVIVYQKINAVMIRNMMDNAAVGQFSVAETITELALFVPLVVAQTVTPLLVKMHHEDPVRYREKRQQFMDIMVWSAMGIAAAISVMAAPAIHILYGGQYLAAIPGLQIMAWRAVFAALSFASAQLIIIENLQQHAIMRNLSGCIVSVGLNYLLIPLWGINGSAVAAVAAVACSGYLAHFIIRPYRFLTSIQSKAIFLGWKQPLRFIVSKIRG
jgi:O-antigen/teichoic acid export membrane protein